MKILYIFLAFIVLNGIATKVLFEVTNYFGHLLKITPVEKTFKGSEIVGQAVEVKYLRSTIKNIEADKLIIDAMSKKNNYHRKFEIEKDFDGFLIDGTNHDKELEIIKKDKGLYEVVVSCYREDGKSCYGSDKRKKFKKHH